MTPLERLQEIGRRHGIKGLIDDWIAKHVREVSTQIVLDEYLFDDEKNTRLVAARFLSEQIAQFAQVTTQDTLKRDIKTYTVFVIKGQP